MAPKRKISAVTNSECTVEAASTSRDEAANRESETVSTALTLRPRRLRSQEGDEDFCEIGPKLKKRKVSCTVKHIERHKKKLHDIYGLAVADIVPKGYRSEAHKAPSKAFLGALCNLANTKGTEHPSLEAVRLDMIAGCGVRLGNGGPRTDCTILLSDIEVAIELRKRLNG